MDRRFNRLTALAVLAFSMADAAQGDVPARLLCGVPITKSEASPAGPAGATDPRLAGVPVIKSAAPSSPPQPAVKITVSPPTDEAVQRGRERAGVPGPTSGTASIASDTSGEAITPPTSGPPRVDGIPITKSLPSGDLSCK